MRGAGHTRPRAACSAASRATATASEARRCRLGRAGCAARRKAARPFADGPNTPAHAAWRHAATAAWQGRTILVGVVEQRFTLVGGLDLRVAGALSKAKHAQRVGALLRSAAAAHRGGTRAARARERAAARRNAPGRRALWQGIPARANPQEGPVPSRLLARAGRDLRPIRTTTHGSCMHAITRSHHARLS